MRRRPSWLRRLLLRLAGEPLPPTASDRATHFLAVEDGWPWAPALQRLRRWLSGRPERSPTDTEAMRTDAVRIGERIGRSAQRHGPTGTVDAGLQGLVARTLERIRATGRRQAPRLANALGSATRAQALLNRRQGELEEADAEVVLRRRAIPEPPRLGVALTGRVAHVVTIFLLLVPLEAFLTFPTLQILTYTDVMTQRLCVLIALGIALGAEGAASMLAHVARTDERRDPARRGLYWVTALLATAAVVGGVVTLDQMARAREHNEALSYEIAHGLTGTGTSTSAGGGSFQVQGGAAGAGGAAGGSAGGGFSQMPGGAAGAGAAGGTGTAATSAPSGAEIAAAAGTPDLNFMLALQVFAFIAAVIFALRVHVAAPYRSALRRLAAAERAVRRRNRAMGRADRRAARTRAELDQVQRDIRLGVRQEVDHLAFLLARARERHDQQFRDGHPPPIELPVLPDAEELVNELLDPEHPLLRQPDVAPPPLGDPPPRGTAPPPQEEPPLGRDEPRTAREEPAPSPHGASGEPDPEPAEPESPPVDETARDGEMSDLLRDLEERLFASRGTRSTRDTPSANGNGEARYGRTRPDDAAGPAASHGPSEIEEDERDDARVGDAGPSELDDDLDANRAPARGAERRSELDDEPDPDEDPLTAVPD